MHQFTTPCLTDRFSLSMDGLCRAVAARIAGGGMTAAMIVLVWGRLRRIEVRVLALIAAIRAGRVRSAPARSGVMRGASDGVRPPLPGLPRRFAWLLPMVPYEAAGFASQLRHVFSDPEMVALLAASPRMGALLRPLCRMLGLEAELVTLVVVAAPVQSICAAAPIHAAESGGLDVDRLAVQSDPLPVAPKAYPIFGLA